MLIGQEGNHSLAESIGSLPPGLGLITTLHELHTAWSSHEKLSVRPSVRLSNA